MRLPTLTILATAIGLTAASGAARAEDPDLVLDQIRDSGVLRVPVMVGEEPGYVLNPETGEWGGFYMEWSNQIADVLGVEVETVETTWGNLAADFQAGRIDLALGLNPNPQRGLVVDYLSVPLFTDAWALVAREGFDRTTWGALNDPDVTLVVQSGSTMQVVAEAITPDATLTMVETRPLGALEIQAGRADAMLVAIFDAVRVQGEIGGEIIVPEPMLRNPATIGVARVEGNAGYLNWLTNWVNQQRALGLAQGTLHRYFTEYGIDLSALPDNFSF